MQDHKEEVGACRGSNGYQVIPKSLNTVFSFCFVLLFESPG